MRMIARSGMGSPYSPATAVPSVAHRALNLRRGRADGARVWERCRYCGSSGERGLVVLAGEHTCPRCASSPLCDNCGHQRESHVGVFRDGARACKHVWLDLPSLTKVGCDCAGFGAVEGAFRDAGFAELSDEDSSLRLA